MNYLENAGNPTHSHQHSRPRKMISLKSDFMAITSSNDHGVIKMLYSSTYIYIWPV